MECLDQATLLAINEGEKAMDELVKSTRKACQPGEQKPDEKDEAQTLLERAIEGKLEIRSKLGQQFYRSAEGGQCSEYKAMRTHHAKSDFQKRWCQMRLQSYTMSKTKRDDFRKVDKSKGTYKSFRQLAIKEGADKAKTYCSKCIKMGGGWLEWDEMYEHWTFFEIEKSYIQEFTRAWGLHCSSSSSSGPSTPSVGGAPLVPSGSAAREDETTVKATEDIGEPKKNPKGNPTSKRKSKAVKADAAKEDPPTKAPRGDGKGKHFTVEQKAQKTKALYLSTLSSCDNLLTCISADASWGIFNNDEQLAPIRDAKIQLIDKVKTSQFIQDYMTLKATSVEKKYSDMQAQCVQMSMALDPMLSRVARETAALVQMKLARESALAK